MRIKIIRLTMIGVVVAGIAALTVMVYNQAMHGEFSRSSHTISALDSVAGLPGQATAVDAQQEQAPAQSTPTAGAIIVLPPPVSATTLPPIVVLPPPPSETGVPVSGETAASGAARPLLPSLAEGVAPVPVVALPVTSPQTDGEPIPTAVAQPPLDAQPATPGPAQSQPTEAKPEDEKDKRDKEKKDKDRGDKDKGDKDKKDKGKGDKDRGDKNKPDKDRGGKGGKP